MSTVKAVMRLPPAAVVFLTVVIALCWRPFLIGFYGDDFSHTTATSFEDALFYGRRERLLYFFPIAIPRYFFGHDHIGWGLYAIIVSGLTAAALYAFYRSVLVRFADLAPYATPAAMAGAILYIFMPWSLTPVLWNTGLSQLVMVALLALAGWALFSSLPLKSKAATFVILFSVSSLIYETIWGAWIPLIMIKFALDTHEQRRETAVITAWSVLAQLALIANYLPSYGVTGRVMSKGDIALGYKASLFVENATVRFPFEVLSSMGILGILVTPFLIYVLYGLLKHRKSYSTHRLWLVFLSCLAGILGGILVVTLGNYRISATSDDARFLSVVSIWLSLLVALIAAVIWSKKLNTIRISSYIIYVLIIASFFLRAGEWVQGYFYQREAIRSVPVEQIRQLVQDAQTDGRKSPRQTKIILLVEFDTPTTIFHGLDNNRGTNFISEKIKATTGIELFTIPTNRRILKTVFEGTHLYQYRCLNKSDFLWNDDDPAYFIMFWHVETGELRQVSSPFSYGCTRQVHPWEVLLEFLYPFSGNPRRP